jgi:(p)ppGpp synthase/HD superfamily hydrolase
VTDDRRGTNTFVIEVSDLRQLQEIMGAIREIPDVANVERVRGL